MYTGKIYILCFYLLTLSAVLSSCSGGANNGKVKTLNKKVLNENKIDTSKSQQKEDDVEPTYATILKDQIESYKEKINIDTSFISDSRDTMFVQFKYYCTYDNKISLPARYFKDFGLSNFHTHDFESSLVMKINSKIVFRGLIRKEDFDPILFDALRKYGVLTSPGLMLSKDVLIIDYTVDIPLTDVGKGVDMSIDTAGNKHLLEN